MNMKDEIYLAYLEYLSKDGGKVRPVLLMYRDEQSYYVFSITSQYENKSPAIQKKYFEITDWETSNLHRASWIDTGNLYALRKGPKLKIKRIGKLSAETKSLFQRFLKQQSGE